ncbi:PepSY domain-containing protein [Luteolibacter pohnpeiensis]|uniref:PepSY domain-containing protein n=2 Tax=Luteolibacter pohnpeiensis TaxID=454153 RepID=A0A934S8G7_9BACT|nr:PepSY domain-containing protein [Luteolibacter pohnpeiensis]
MSLPQTIRKGVFWAHLAIGLLAGVMVLSMSVTGILMVYERQIIEWVDGVTVKPSAEALPLESVIGDEFSKQVPPSSILLSSKPTEPIGLQYGREKTVYFDPYTGKSLGEGSQSASKFFHSVESWHRWLGQTGEKRTIGKSIVDSANLMFLFIVVSGLWLWFPRRWTKSGIKAITRIQPRLKGRAWEWNLHNVFGFWACIPLFIIVTTGTIMAFPWANALIFKAVGEEAPQGRGGPRGGKPGGRGEGARTEGGGTRNEGRGESRGEGRGPGERSERNERGGRGGRGEGQSRGQREGEGRGRGERGGLETQTGSGTVSLVGLNAAYQTVAKSNPDWETMRIEMLADHQAKFSVTDSHRGRPDRRQEVTMDLAKNQIVPVSASDKQSLGRQIRGWVRWVHTGEAGGWIGQTIAAFAAGSAAVLVWSGFALSWRRFFGKRKRSKAAMA